MTEFQRSAAGNHREFLVSLQASDQFIGHSESQVILVFLAAGVGKGKHDDRGTGNQGLQLTLLPKICPVLEYGVVNDRQDQNTNDRRLHWCKVRSP